MIAIDEEALICDMAETYSVYDYKSLPVHLAAIFACGLRDSSRIKKRLADVNISTEELLLAGMFDRLNWLVWSKTRDGQQGIGAPVSMTSLFLRRQQDREVECFNTSGEYETRRRELIKGENNA